MNRLLIGIALVLLTGNMVLTLWNGTRTPSIAYVRSQELVYGYLGMKEAMAEFQGKQTLMKANLDTLSADLSRSVQRMRNERPSLDVASLRDREQLLRKQQQDIVQYQESMNSQLAEQEKDMLASVLAQVNSYVEEYAELKGYDVVLGSTASGSLLYGEGTMDITEELLSALNAQYEDK